MSDAFISYSRLDKVFVGKLREALANKGQDVWIDWESIPASQLWWQEIRKGIAKANNFVLIMSPNSMSSPICHMEIEYARVVGKRIIPVVHADFEREDCLLNIAKRLATGDETATREIWGTRQAHDLYDANLKSIKPINYFFFKADADFQLRFDELFKIIDTDPIYKEKHTTLGLRAAEWDRRGRDVSFLLLGNELTDAEQWRQDATTGKEPSPTELQIDYISASRRARRRRRIYIGSGVLTGIIALMFAIGASLVGANAINQVADAKVEQEISLQLAQASLRIAEKQNVEALQIGDSLVEHYPNKVLAYMSRAIIYANNSLTEKALSDYTKAIEINPEYRDAYYNRGNIYYDLKQYDKALADYNKAFEIGPKIPSLYTNRGLTYLALKQYDDALVDLRIAQVGSMNASDYSNLGLAYYDLKQYDNALVDFSLALGLDPYNAKVYYIRGNTYHALKEYDKGLEDYNKAIELNPNYVEAFYNRGNTSYALKQYDKAIADYSKAIELDPNYVEAFYNRGSTYGALKQYDKAIADYSKAIELDPNKPNAYGNRANTYGTLKQYDKAIADHSKAIELDPHNDVAYYNRGNTYSDLKEYDKALEDYSKAIELDPNYTSAYFNRGNTYSNLKQYDMALKDYDKCLTIDPQFAKAYWSRGNVYWNQSKTAFAIADYRKYEELTGKLEPFMAQRIAEVEEKTPTVTATTTTN